MVDITMCMNKSCPLRSKCYRYRAVPSNWQSFAMYKPSITLNGSLPIKVECEYFWEIDGRVLLSVEEADGRYVPEEIKKDE